MRITTGAQNEAMRALANKFGAHLTFRYGESTGSIDLKQQARPEPARPAIATPFDAARAMVSFNREYWKFLQRMYGWGEPPDARPLACAMLSSPAGEYAWQSRAECAL